MATQPSQSLHKSDNASLSRHSKPNSNQKSPHITKHDNVKRKKEAATRGEQSGALVSIPRFSEAPQRGIRHGEMIQELLQTRSPSAPVSHDALPPERSAPPSVATSKALSVREGGAMNPTRRAQLEVDCDASIGDFLRTTRAASTWRSRIMATDAALAMAMAMAMRRR
jgi:hypothetical protein